jgi:hypothetical protein
MSLFADSFRGGDIWSSAFTFDSPLKDLLERPAGFSTQDLLDEDELLQEVKALNGTLVDYVSRRGTLEELLRYIAEAPKEEEAEAAAEASADGKDGAADADAADAAAAPAAAAEEEAADAPSSEAASSGAGDSPSPKKRLIPIPASSSLSVRYPYMACEVICCDVAQIVDAIVDAGAEESAEDKDEDKDKDTNKAEDGESAAPPAPSPAPPPPPPAPPPSSPSPSPISGGNPLLDVLFSLLLLPAPLPPRVAGYFEKVLTVLFRRRPAALAAYVSEAGRPLFELFAKHLWCAGGGGRRASGERSEVWAKSEGLGPSEGLGREREERSG